MHIHPKLPKCKECSHQFSWKEIIKSQWSYGLKDIQCKSCKTEFPIKNSFLLYLLFFMIPTIIFNSFQSEDDLSKDFSLSSLQFLTELTTSLLILLLIWLALPYIAKLGEPHKNKA